MSVNEMLMAAAGSAGAANEYVDDVFSTWLYTGTGASQTITNGIDLAGKGGLTWIKSRSNTQSHYLIDSGRGISKLLNSNNTFGQGTDATNVTAYNSNGFTVQGADVNSSTYTYASWTFRKAPKFFDVVTYTGNGASTRDIAHSLGSAPGMIIVKRTDTASNWFVWHRSSDDNILFLEQSAAATSSAGFYFGNSTTQTSTNFRILSAGGANVNGGTYVAYLFAHNAGGFGDAGTDNIISCGSFTTAGSGNTTVNLGYEPQWVLIKRTDSTSGWLMFDSMRGLVAVDNINSARLFANTNAAEDTSVAVQINATGFSTPITGSSSWIYMAIRRPMKKPTSGTQVYENVAYSGDQSSQRQIGSTVLMDMMLLNDRNATSNAWPTYAHYVYDRLRGDDCALATSSTAGESTGWQNYLDSDRNIGWDTSSETSGNQVYLNRTGTNYVSHIFRRATGFFDVVCYTGTGSLAGVPHNLGVTPELKIIKRRNSTADWIVGGSILGEDSRLFLNLTDAVATSSNYWDGGNDSSTVFSVRNTNTASDSSGGTYVAYLFATLAGVSKVGSYTGNGTNGRVIDCGFSAGARFVLIKRTDTTGSWRVFDTARGIVSGSDPYLFLDTAVAEEAGIDAIDPSNSGFIVNNTAGFNTNGASYIYLAIA